MKYYLKTIGIGFAVCLGIISGIFIGFRIVGEQKVSAVVSNIPGDFGVPDEMKLPFGAGDPLPLFQLETIQGDKLQNQYLYGKKSAVIIAALECGPCEEFMNQWNQIVTPNLKSNTQVIVLISHADSTPLEVLPDYLKDKRVFQIDRKQLEDKYNSVYFPTAILVDENGIVKSVQYGQQRGINYEILKFLTTHDI